MNKIQAWLREKVFGAGPLAWSARDWTYALRGNVPGVVGIDSLMRSGAVIACSQLISDSLAAADLAVVQRLPGGGVAPVLQSDAVSALATISFDDRASSVFDVCARGNGWLWYDNGTLSALDSARLLVTIAPDGQVWIKQNGIDGYINYADTVHFRWRKQSGFVLGWSPLQMAADSMGTAQAIVRMGGALAQNVAHPGGVLESPSALSEKAINNIKKSWGESVGADKTGSVAVLEEGVKYRGGKEMGIPSAADSQMVDAMDWAVSEVARLYGIPNSLLNITGDVNKATASEEARAFYNRALRPWAARIDDTLTRRLVSPEDQAQGICIEHSLQTLSIGSGVEQIEYVLA